MNIYWTSSNSALCAPSERVDAESLSRAMVWKEKVPTEWPPRSLDLTPADFFLWGYLKSVVSKTQPNSIEDLQQLIRQEYFTRDTPDGPQTVLG